MTTSRLQLDPHPPFRVLCASDYLAPSIARFKPVNLSSISPFLWHRGFDAFYRTRLPSPVSKTVSASPRWQLKAERFIPSRKESPPFQIKQMDLMEFYDGIEDLREVWAMITSRWFIRNIDFKKLIAGYFCYIAIVFYKYFIMYFFTCLYIYFDKWDTWKNTISIFLLVFWLLCHMMIRRKRFVS